MTYEQIGAGPHRVVALHGWFSDRTGWDAIWPHLDGERFTYAFVDYRGYGASKDVPGEFTVEEIARDVVALADELGWEAFSLLGHSMGSCAGERILADAPQRVRAIVGVTPVPSRGVPMDARAYAFYAAAADEPENRRTIIDVTTGRRLTHVWVSHMVARSLAVSNRDAFASYLQSWAKTDFHDRITGNPVPVHVIIGENDPGITEKFMRSTLLAWYPNADLEIMANAGHYPMDETPLALVSSIERFLAART